MPDFSYQGLNEKQSKVAGKISADTVSAAVAQLESQSLLVLSIQKIETIAAALSTPEVAGKLNADEQALCQRIAEVLEKRAAILPGLVAFAQELPPGPTRRRLNQLIGQLESGATAEQLYAGDERTIAWLLLLGRGTISQPLFSDLFDDASRENESRMLWNRTLIYPAIVFLGSIGVLIFLCFSVVPIFKSIFDDFDMNLPLLTIGIIDVSNTIHHNPLGFLLSVVGLVAGFYVVVRLICRFGFRGRLGILLTAGNSAQVTDMAQFTGRLAVALENGLPLPDALRVAGGIKGSSITRRLARQLAKEVVQPCFDLNSSPIARWLPATVVHALQAGTGNQPSIPLLHQLSELYTVRVQDRQRGTVGLMGPVAIIGMGITVGFVVMALFLPLVQLINGLSG